MAPAKPKYIKVYGRGDNDGYSWEKSTPASRAYKKKEQNPKPAPKARPAPKPRGGYSARGPKAS